jgi:hypothetical protein
MSEDALKKIAEVRQQMAEKFGKKICKFECTVDEAIAIQIAIKTILDQGVEDFMVSLLNLAHMRIQQGLDAVKP